MEFNFLLPEMRREEIYIPSEMELWTPLEDKPSLNEKEMSTIFNEDEVIDTLHIAIPSFLVSTESEEFGYYPCFELGKYFLVGKLRQSPYLVFYEERESSPRMQKLIKEGFLKDKKNYYLFDSYFTPFFGGFAPKYFLFQRINFATIPEAMVLFRDLS